MQKHKYRFSGVPSSSLYNSEEEAMSDQTENETPLLKSKTKKRSRPCNWIWALLNLAKSYLLNALKNNVKSKCHNKNDVLSVFEKLESDFIAFKEKKNELQAIEKQSKLKTNSQDHIDNLKKTTERLIKSLRKGIRFLLNRYIQDIIGSDTSYRKKLFKFLKEYGKGESRNMIKAIKHADPQFGKLPIEIALLLLSSNNVSFNEPIEDQEAIRSKFFKFAFAFWKETSLKCQHTKEAFENNESIAHIRKELTESLEALLSHQTSICSQKCEFAETGHSIEEFAAQTMNHQITLENQLKEVLSQQSSCESEEMQSISDNDLNNQENFPLIKIKSFTLSHILDTSNLNKRQNPFIDYNSDFEEFYVSQEILRKFLWGQKKNQVVNLLDLDSKYLTSSQEMSDFEGLKKKVKHEYSNLGH